MGIDSLNIDDTDDGGRPAHTALLAAGIPIVEPLCGLDELPAAGGRFFAVPVMVKGDGHVPRQGLRDRRLTYAAIVAIVSLLARTG